MVNRGVNKVILVGYLGQVPEVRYMPNGNMVTNFSIATTESWKDKKTNELREKTEWHRVVLFGKLAEIASEYLRKGSQVYIEGSLRTRKWQNPNGQERTVTEVVVNIGGTMQMLSGGAHKGYDKSDHIRTSDDYDKSTETISNNTEDDVNFDINNDVPF